MNEKTEVVNQAVKVISVWAAIGITDWAQAASFLAFIYSFILLSEWTWKKIIRPSLVHFGYAKPAAPNPHATVWTPGDE